MKIYLVGFMGSGKSTAGKKLAAALGFSFCDLDQLIESETGLRIKEIFSKGGEDYFREIEKEIIRKTGSLTNCVIACGGGTPCFHDNMRWMNNSGITVYLEMSPRQLQSRLKVSGANRPLISGLEDDALAEYINTTLAGREPFYQQAKITVRGMDISIAKLTALVWEEHPPGTH